MESVNQKLGNHLRQRRMEKQLSLDQAAAQTGVSKAMLGQIERGESSPTIATLWKIATGLHLSFSTLTQNLLPEPVSALRGSIEAERIPTANTDIQVTTLFPFDPTLGFEVMSLLLQPGSQSMSEPHDAKVTEHCIVVSGTLDFLLNNEWITLQAGEAIRFAADQPHGYRNSGNVPTFFHDIIHYG
ncbi:helix-turn-helix domain-containing protein [Salinispirillum marinum]|uniref:Helix-turn-helix domain-containing protein n=2 Tax=Saccharospirillaceae TaxID=255527 RepID=A0ABV8BG67_9GAMM